MTGMGSQGFTSLDLLRFCVSLYDDEKLVFIQLDCI